MPRRDIQKDKLRQKIEMGKRKNKMKMKAKEKKRKKR